MMKIYPLFSLTFFCALAFNYAPLRATEALQPQSAPATSTVEYRLHPPADAPVVLADRASRKLHLREQLLLHLLEKNILKDRKHAAARSRNAPGEDGKGKDMNAASLMLGIGGLVLLAVGFSGSFILVLLGLGLAVLGLVLGIRGVVKNYPKRGLGIAGIIVSGVALTYFLVAAFNFLSRYE